MVRSQLVPTSRLAVHCLIAGPDDAPPVVLVHGNISTGRFFDALVESLATRYYVIAPDMRGFGGTDPKPIDATRGLRDFSDDIHELLAELGVDRPVHLLGWSVGGGVVLQFAIDHPDQVASLVLEAPMSPFGFGGTRDLQGTPCFPDFAGSGGGTANPEFVRLMREGDRSSAAPVSPRSVLKGFVIHPGNPVDAAREEEYLGELLKTRIGDDHYPGDLQTSPNWPGVAPGARGMNNAISPKYVDLSALPTIARKPPILWIRGADDVIVSDASLFDFGNLGRLGAVPGWPGMDVCPPQPMIGQMRALLDAYAGRGGRYEELVFADCVHSPHLERPAQFLAALDKFFAG
jgi:pimeloyl-ACP methyl ester carboxylesterase